jgi:hypothetical protein
MRRHIASPPDSAGLWSRCEATSERHENTGCSRALPCHEKAAPIPRTEGFQHPTSKDQGKERSLDWAFKAGFRHLAGRNHVVVDLIRTKILWVGSARQSSSDGRNPCGMQTPPIACSNTSVRKSAVVGLFGRHKFLVTAEAPGIVKAKPL